ncbi:hypothetical protein A3D77_06320 [Candidatus Gottesmanbacteria bacterium RIFCSPHIGHO2_02_FULL_39_11]|uniref:Addiction module toxin RelE n=1 Tax=Candidatus Gottesmanbacteria bacterium RIFCSPHIGHO2_02_FULL_39_11 TaxID=1798382 RepID=A0A1F5ZPR8_9BACT|nr:MAG: hypothetical protein A3D77_06320 [Candidatus Gottesmanbacteria bacterium RIFCSPHIGHO2_02_FULL_39_11]
MKLEFSKNALKNLQKIPFSEHVKIQKKLDDLMTDPFLGKKLQGEFENLRSLKAWPYRILYTIEDNIILIYKISHRQGVYKS